MDSTAIDAYALTDSVESLPDGYYNGMADPLYAWESTGSIVLYDDRGHDTVSMARLNIPCAEDNDAADDTCDAEGFRAFAEAWEPVAEELSDHAEDLNLTVGGDRRAIVEGLADRARAILPDAFEVTTGALHGTRSGYRVYARLVR